MSRVGLLSLVLVALLASGCATIVSGRHQKIRVTSAPLRARVIVEYQKADGGQVSSYETPAEIHLPRRKSDVRLRIEKEGFAPVEVALKRKANGMLALNVANPMIYGAVITDGSAGARAGAIAAFIGVWIGVDVATGAAYRLAPSRIDVTLTPAQTTGTGSQARSGQ